MPEPRIRESLRAPLNGDRDTPSSAGGAIVIMKAGVAGLKYGDLVRVSSTVDDSVATSTTATDGPFFAGVIVGGGSVGGYDRAFFGAENVGLAIMVGVGQGAAIGANVLVQVNGIAWVTANGAIARGGTVGFSTVAGRVLANAVAGQIVGVALRAAAGAGSVIPILIGDH